MQDVLSHISSAVCHITLEHGCRATGGILLLSDQTVQTDSTKILNLSTIANFSSMETVHIFYEEDSRRVYSGKVFSSVQV